MHHLAESYVKLVLAVGEYDENYVDAYYGPAAWREEIKRARMPLEAVERSATGILETLHGTMVHPADEMTQRRKQYLIKHLEALIAHIEMLSGKQMSFEEEAQALYDVKPPVHTEEDFQEILRGLESLLPGSGPLADRYEEFRKSFIIPNEKLDPVFQAAIAECRRRTKSHIQLPANERFSLEYVKDKPWSGYNWFKGSGFSLIQINTDLPVHIDRAVDLAAHEGYPGHHVYNMLLEQHLAKERNWVEFTVYALFSPQSLIAEGTANFGIDVAFPGNQRLQFEENVLFPLAGLDRSRVVQYYIIHQLVLRLNYTHNEAARRYLNGKFTREQAEDFLMTYALMSRERARQRVRFIDTYRSYVINYSLGQDLVKRHIESQGGRADRPEVRWQQFICLLSSPLVPSYLQCSERSGDPC